MPKSRMTRLAASITRAASKQTFHTIRYLVDQDRISEAYKAYAYFRWVDDSLDQGQMSPAQRIAFINRQMALIDCCYIDSPPDGLRAKERMLVSLIQGDNEPNSGLESYIRNMMAVMSFDARRRGQLITHEQLEKYENHLAVAIMEALHYFIGHGQYAPQSKARHLAAKGAHITHMLRDAIEDNAAGYFNIPSEYLQFHQISPQAVHSRPYRAWVKSRVHQARECFTAGKHYLAQVENLRCRLAGYLYICRFESVLDVIEREGYQLRAEYLDRQTFNAAAKPLLSALWQVLQRPVHPTYSQSDFPPVIKAKS